MKNFKKNELGFLIAFFLITITMASCTNNDIPNSNINTPTSIINIVNNGTWRITYYYDTDHEETNNFNGYNFTFGASNILTASNGTDINTGTWTITDSNSNDDNISDLDFNISFGNPAQFVEISDDWEIMEKSNTVIKLKDVSGGNGGIDYLTFTKN
ncbi:MAG: hypothetical protein NT127_05800 [Sphingobacteriales bacterium]|nr:hypothetical protein [Sphingobacteriales bacterium]